MIRRRPGRWTVLLAILALAALVLFATGIAGQAIDAASLMARIARAETETQILRSEHPLIRTADSPALASDTGDATPGAVRYPADLYWRADIDAIEALATSAALVLVPGASPGGKDEPRLVEFAEILAASGFVVLVPDLPGLRGQQVDPSHAGDIAAIATYLAGLTGDRPVAVVAISYAVGPAVIAAAQQEDADPIALILGIGGYYDAIATTIYVTTGRVPDGAAGWVPRAPNAYGKWVFVWSNLARIQNPNDRGVLDAMVRRKFDDPAAPVDDLVAALGSEGLSVWDLLSNEDPARVPALIERLPPAISEALAGLDLASLDLAGLDATLLLVHGADDPILPPEGSTALAEAAPNSELYLLDSLAHVDLSLASLADAWTLYRACWSLIGWRDRLAAGHSAP